MFNPPDIECGSDYRDKIFDPIYYKENKDKENKENSLNMSLDKKYLFNSDNNELLDYLFNYLTYINNHNNNINLR
jgi:hypothetical protein